MNCAVPSCTHQRTPVTTRLPFCMPSCHDSFVHCKLRKISWCSGAVFWLLPWHNSENTLGGGADSKFPELQLCLEKVTSLDSTVDKAALKAAASLFFLCFLVFFFFFFFQDIQVSCEIPSPACRTMAKNDGGLKLLPQPAVTAHCRLKK